MREVTICSASQQIMNEFDEEWRVSDFDSGSWSTVLNSLLLYWILLCSPDGGMEFCAVLALDLIYCELTHFALNIGALSVYSDRVLVNSAFNKRLNTADIFSTYFVFVIVGSLPSPYPVSFIDGHLDIDSNSRRHIFLGLQPFVSRISWNFLCGRL